MNRQGHLSEDYLTNNKTRELQDNIEAADQAHQVDLHGAGILTGLEVTENDPAPTMALKVAAGTAYQGLGRRIRVDVGQSFDCSVDREAAATVPSAGQERYITLLAVFNRQESAPVLDPITGESISRISDEYFELQVAAGAEAAPGNAVKYVAAPEEVILADVLLDDATTALTNAMIDDSRRSILPRVETMAAYLTGVIKGLLVTRSEDDSLSITAGWCHLKDAAGVSHAPKIEADTSLDVAGLAGAGVRYIYIDADGALTASAVPPTYASAKQGFYNAAGDKRFIGSWTFAAGVFVGGTRSADGSVRWDSDISLGNITANGFTNQDVSAFVPSIEDALAQGYTYNPGVFISVRKDGTSGTGTMISLRASAGSDQGNIYFESPVSSAGIFEIDSSNTPLQETRLCGYKEQR